MRHCLPIFNSNIFIKYVYTSQYSINRLEETLNYCYKGSSILCKSIIVYGAKTIYILNSSGSFLSKIDLSEFDTGFKNWHIAFIQQLSLNLYSCCLEADDMNLDLGFIIVFDLNKNIINKYNLINKNCNFKFDGHSYLIKNLHNLYLCGNLYLERQKISNCIIQEQKDGKVVWQWETIEHPELYDYVIMHKLGAPHINYISELDDDHLLVSYRNIGFVNICKSKNSIEWVIGEKRNDLGFKDLPCLQHCIEWMNPEHTKFATFNNNWDKAGIAIKALIDNPSAYENILNQRLNSQVIIYDLENKTSKAYDTGIPASPRQGNVIHIKDNIFDINYGQCLMHINKRFYRLGLFQEINFDTNKINLEMVFNSNQYVIRRGF